jgi:hypothetical protein
MSTRNITGGIGWPERKADNLTAICEPIFKKMWDPRPLTTLWAPTACYRDSVSFFTLVTILISQATLNIGYITQMREIYIYIEAYIKTPNWNKTVEIMSK